MNRKGMEINALITLLVVVVFLLVAIFAIWALWEAGDPTSGPSAICRLTRGLIGGCS